MAGQVARGGPNVVTSGSHLGPPVVAGGAAVGNPENQFTTDSLGNRIHIQSGLTPEQEAARALVLNPGTTHETTAGYQWDHPGIADNRGFMFGRTAGGADQQVQHARNIGDVALGTGDDLLSEGKNLAAGARDRAAPTGDFTAQNNVLEQQRNVLGASLGYGQLLGGLEAQQGPSAAQAQLQNGTNMGMAQQIALARSGRGFGGGAAAMGLAQSNEAGIAANQANQAAQLSAQENAAWRGRQATNFGNAAGIVQGVGSQYGQQGTQYGQQSNTNLDAALRTTAQNDAASQGYLNFGGTAYGQGVSGALAGMGVENQVRGMELSAGEQEQAQLFNDWAARNGFAQQDKAAAAQQQAALIQGAATTGGALIGTFGGPAGTVAGGAAAGAAANALTKK